jgi:hypothetical protein
MLWKSKMFLIVVLIAAVYSFVVYTYMDQINGMDYIYQFLLTIFVIVGVSYLLGAHINGTARRLVGFMGALFAVDLLIPPLLVTTQGVLSQADIVGGSIDAIVYSLWSGIGLTGTNLWIAIYPVSFVILLSTSLYLLSPSTFRRVIGHAVT